MIDEKIRQRYIEESRTKSLFNGVANLISEGFKNNKVPSITHIEDDTKIVNILNKIGQAIPLLYKTISKPTILPKIFQIKGQVEVTKQSSVNIKNFPDLEKYFKSLEQKLILLARSVSNAPPPVVNIPKIDIPKGKDVISPKLESLIESLNEKIDKLQPQEFKFPKKMEISNFPAQMIPQPVTHVSINSVSGFIKTTAATVTSALTILPTYGVLSNRRSMIIFNNSTQTVYIGGSDVTTSNGLPVPKNTYSPPLDNGILTILYGTVVSGSANVRVMEISDEASGR